jgi:polysaccharide export outer membrane protein
VTTRLRATLGLLTLLALAAPAAAQISATRPAPAAAAADSADKKTKPQAPSPADDYRLGAGDKLRIEVYKDAQLSQSVQVRPDGKITLPLIGDMEATGRTPIELRDTIAHALKEYMTNPVVTVIVVEATAATAYVMGEVAHPGSIKLDGPVTVLQALALAGGLKDFADAKNIRILRKSGAAGTQTIAFNYKDAVKGQGMPVYLRPGDTVVVPD